METNECWWKDGLSAGEGSGSLGGGKGGGPREARDAEARDAEARKDRFECDLARRVCTGVAFDAYEGEWTAAVAVVGVRRSASVLCCFVVARPAELDAALRIGADSSEEPFRGEQVEEGVLTSGTRLTAAPLRVALIGVRGNGSSAA